MDASIHFKDEIVFLNPCKSLPAFYGSQAGV